MEQRAPWWARPYSEGRAWMLLTQLAAPAAGANATFTVPETQAVRLRGATARLVTSATVANRQLTLDYLDPLGNLLLSNGGAVLQAASATNDYRWSSARGLAEWTSGSPLFAPLEPVLLPPVYQVRWTIAGVQAADQLSQLALYYEIFT